MPDTSDTHNNSYDAWDDLDFRNMKQVLFATLIPLRDRIVRDPNSILINKRMFFTPINSSSTCRDEKIVSPDLIR